MRMFFDVSSGEKPGSKPYPAQTLKIRYPAMLPALPLQRPPRLPFRGESACRIPREKSFLLRILFEEGVNLFDLSGQPRHFALQYGKPRHYLSLWAEHERIRFIAAIECCLCSHVFKNLFHGKRFDAFFTTGGRIAHVKPDRRSGQLPVTGFAGQVFMELAKESYRIHKIEIPDGDHHIDGVEILFTAEASGKIFFLFYPGVELSAAGT